MDLRKNPRRCGARGQTTLAQTLKPNNNITVPIGPKALVDMVFDEFGLKRILTGMKRNQGSDPYDVAKALVICAMQMEGLSINRMEDILEDPHRKEAYGLGDDVTKDDLYRVCKRLGTNLDAIVAHINTTLRERFGMSFKEVILDWSASYLDGKPTDIIRFGYSKDHRPDRPQVNIGMAMESAEGLLCGLTVVAGNTNDAKHFRETFAQVKPFLDRKCLLVFDAGAYGEENARLVTEAGFDYLTRVQLTSSDEKHIRIPEGEWLRIDGDVRARMYRGNGRKLKVLFFSRKRRDELLASYRAKAERDYDEAIELKAMVAKGKPRKKYRSSNVFLKTSIGYTFPLDMDDREKSIERAIQERITGREGYFVLTSTRMMLPGDMLRTYRSRNRIEDAYRDLKHGIDIRPLRCRNDESVKGRVLIAYLALLSLQFAKFVAPEIRRKTAETLVDELTSFALTVEFLDKGGKRLVYSNFNATVRAIMRGFERIPELIKARKKALMAPDRVL